MTHGQKPYQVRKSFGQRLRYLRRQKNFTLIELAKRVGISTSYLGVLETDPSKTPPSERVLKKLADVFEISRSNLYRGTTQLDIRLLREATYGREDILRFVQAIASGQNPLPHKPIFKLQNHVSEISLPKGKKPKTTEFGKKLKIIRESKNYSKSYLANESGISVEDITRYERLGRVSPPKLLSLAKALSVKMEELVDLAYGDKIDNPPNKLGRFLRRERLKLGLTASMASRQAGFKPSFLSHVEGGYDISISSLKKLARVLKIDVDEALISAGKFDESELQARVESDAAAHELIEELLLNFDLQTRG